MKRTVSRGSVFRQKSSDAVGDTRLADRKQQPNHLSPTE